MVWLPDGVDGGELVVVVLQPQQLLGVLVGQQTGFPQQRLVLELSPRHLPVDGLQAQQEHPVTKATATERGQNGEHGLLPSQPLKTNFL